MNTISVLNTDYLRSSRTLDTFLISNNDLNEIYFVYNYEGISFRLFKTLSDLISFFQDKFDDFIHFDSEEELDEFLLKVEIVS